MDLETNCANYGAPSWSENMTVYTSEDVLEHPSFNQSQRKVRFRPRQPGFDLRNQEHMGDLSKRCWYSFKTTLTKANDHSSHFTSNCMENFSPGQMGLSQHFEYKVYKNNILHYTSKFWAPFLVKSHSIPMKIPSNSHWTVVGRTPGSSRRFQQAHVDGTAKDRGDLRSVAERKTHGNSEISSHETCANQKTFHFELDDFSIAWNIYSWIPIHLYDRYPFTM